jgi:hypothetical protein
MLPRSSGSDRLRARHQGDEVGEIAPFSGNASIVRCVTVLVASERATWMSGVSADT